jgi:RNA ligase (TIGR02306 family)
MSNIRMVDMTQEGLVYIGKIIDIQPIQGADFIVSATVVCGKGGKWRGVVKKDDFELDDHCVVFLPDSIIPERPDMEFMKASNWRVRMRRFKGSPSEVVIIGCAQGWDVGDDVTSYFGVTRYHKPIPVNLQGIAKGDFPGFIPKTDEPNYQRSMDLVDALVGEAYYITEKADGASTTAFRYKGNFGLCSRNLELERNEDNGYWKVCIKYKLEELLPEGYALQWETCGPRIQSNPMGLSEIDGFAFSAYNILEHRYLEMNEFLALCETLKFPTCRLLAVWESFDREGLETLGEGKYANGHQREGVVVRSQRNFDGKPISFKVINLGFEK